MHGQGARWDPTPLGLSSQTKTSCSGRNSLKATTTPAYVSNLRRLSDSEHGHLWPTASKQPNPWCMTETWPDKSVGGDWIWVCVEFWCIVYAIVGCYNINGFLFWGGKSWNPLKYAHDALVQVCQFLQCHEWSHLKLFMSYFKIIILIKVLSQSQKTTFLACHNFHTT